MHILSISVQFLPAYTLITSILLDDTDMIVEYILGGTI